jgi:hypothetical protein
VAQTIYQGIAALRKFPNMGRIGLAENTRELVFSPWPYIAVYEVVDGQVTGASYPPRGAGLAILLSLLIRSSPSRLPPSPW